MWLVLSSHLPQNSENLELTPPPQLLGSFDESEDPISSLLTNLTRNLRTTMFIKLYSNLQIHLGRLYLYFATTTLLILASRTANPQSDAVIL